MRSARPKTQTDTAFVADPFDDRYWNAVQTLAWVCRGDRRLVRRASESFTDYGTYREELRGPDGEIHLVEQPSPPPGIEHVMALSRPTTEAAYPNYVAAKRALLAALQRGLIKAYGLAGGRGDLVEIPQLHWADADIFSERRRPFAAPSDLYREGATRWYGLRFLREQILALWPDPFRAPSSDEFAQGEGYGLAEYDLMPEGAIGLPEAAIGLRDAVFPADANAVSRFEREVWDEDGSRNVPNNEQARERQQELSEHLREAEAKLADAFAGKQLSALLRTSDNATLRLPAYYWRTDQARHTTIRTGRVEPAGGVFAELDQYSGRPCHLERVEFDAWLSGVASDQTASSGSAPDRVDQYRTGLAGRPTISHLILRQLDRRAAAGQLCKSLAAEARALQDWAIRTHTDAPPPKPRSIENIIRRRYKELKGPEPTKSSARLQFRGPVSWIHERVTVPQAPVCSGATIWRDRCTFPRPTCSARRRPPPT